MLVNILFIFSKNIIIQNRNNLLKSIMKVINYIIQNNH